MSEQNEHLEESENMEEPPKNTPTASAVLSDEERARIDHVAQTEGARDPEHTITSTGITVSEARRRYHAQTDAWQEARIRDSEERAKQQQQ